jgi:ribosomal-protein-serine acetyltransferase
MAFSFSLDEDSELRILEKHHAPDIFALTQKHRAYLRAWLPWVDATKSVEDTEKFISITRDQFASNNGFQTSLWHNGEIVGLIGYHWISWPNRLTSIGYWLASDHQGKGLMTKACDTLVTHAFENYNLNRVEIRCAVENLKSRAIPERLGFRLEGQIRDAERMTDGKYVDHAVYGMLARDWKSQSKHMEPS